MSSKLEIRISNLRQQMKKNGIDTFLVIVQENRQYLSGFTGEDTQFDESAGALIINDDTLILATDSRYELQARNEAPLYDVVCYPKGLAKELPSILKRLKSKRVGFESRRLSFDQFTKIRNELESQCLSTELVPCGEITDNLRLIKDADEITSIRNVILLAETAFEKTIQELKPGMSEIEAAWELEKNMRTAGAQALSFPVIAAFGENSALPHAIPGKKLLKENEPVLFDWGAKLNGYCSDATRTFVLGSPDDQFKKIHTIVHDAQKIAIDAIRPGKTTKQIDEIARNHIKGKGFGDYFGHALGHGVGLAIHEAPSLSPLTEKETEITENMVFTVEPGIYLPDWGGIRLENMVLVTKDGAEVLNQLEVNMFISI